MKPFTPFQLREHLKWIYSQPNYYKERRTNEKRRHNKRKTLPGPNKTLPSGGRNGLG